MIKHVIAKHRQRTCEDTVGRLHGRKQTRLLRNPRLGSAWRHGHTNAEPLLQGKPRSEGALHRGTSVVNDMEVALREFRWSRTAFEASQRQMRSTAQSFYYDLSGAKGAEDYQ